MNKTYSLVQRGTQISYSVAVYLVAELGGITGGIRARFRSWDLWSNPSRVGTSYVSPDPFDGPDASGISPTLSVGDIEEDDTDDDDAGADYDISSASDEDNGDNDEEDDISAPLNPLSSTAVNQ
ncbi:hypothetical protein M9H77_27798 [Catharanthus roseus]|uniref:Uncharacterized protein n=1 Tax=Catharanthus roseus TaxID=4058 RepID=A0ACC0ADR6_CATRO|nr:hypothetical protein M9H77_27798 [Catharanthus roseus]